MRPHRNPSRTVAAAHLRRGSLPIVLWAFGLLTTLLLVGLWGRAVVVDDATLAQSARTAVSSEVVADSIYEWIGRELVDVAGLPEADVASALSELRALPAAGEAVDTLFDQAISALFRPKDGAQPIDIAATVEPLVPLIVAELAWRGIEVDTSQISATLDDLDALEIDTDAAAQVAVVADDAREVLSIVVAAALLALFASGSLAVVLSEERMIMVRSLLVRVALSGLSFALLFRLGRWALDPARGGSPVLGGGAVILGSNLHVFVVAGALAAFAAALGWIVSVRRRTRRKRLRLPTGEPEESTSDLSRV